MLRAALTMLVLLVALASFRGEDKGTIGLATSHVAAGGDKGTIGFAAVRDGMHMSG